MHTNFVNYSKSLSRRIRKSSYFQEIAKYTGQPLNPKKWIFVVGCYNSGTTLLSHLLALHPDCSGASNEGVALTNQLATPEDFSWPRMWLSCLNNLEIDPNLPESSSRARIIKRQWSYSFDRDASVIVEKSISNAARIPFFEKYFAPSLFVHIVRDGYAVAEGIRRKAHPHKFNNFDVGERYSLEMCIDQWSLSNRIISAALKEPIDKNHAIVISYEELCRNPDAVLNKIFIAANLTTISNLKQHLQIAGMNHIKNMNQKSYTALKHTEMNLIKERCGNDLAHWGYL